MGGGIHCYLKIEVSTSLLYKESPDMDSPESYGASITDQGFCLSASLP